MLTDRRLKRFRDSFLPVAAVRTTDLFPSQSRTLPRLLLFEVSAQHAHVLEPLLLFETVLIENRSILDLIDPPFSYRSGLLEHFMI